jgi:hypothetical protein
MEGRFEIIRSRDSLVHSDRLQAERPEFDFMQKQDRIWGPSNHLSNVHWGAISPGVKRPGHESYHSSPSYSEIKNGGANLHSRMRLHDLVLN